MVLIDRFHHVRGAKRVVFTLIQQEAGAEEGTGIGLVVAKRLAELMGGAIGAESSVGAGSVFWFELLAAAAPQVAVDGAEPAAVAKAKVQNGGSPHTLLYVEDNSADLNLVEQLIARHTEMRLLPAMNGQSGIAFARAYQPDVVVMDINLPDISSIDVLEILRDDPAREGIPIVALSANAMPHGIANGMQAGSSATDQANQAR